MSLGSMTCWENRNHNPSVFQSFYGAVPASMFQISLKRHSSLLICFLAFLTFLWVRRVENEHAEHEAHIKAEHGGELPAIPDYDYLNRRNKPFPWGMNSLFFNPHVCYVLDVRESLQS